MLFCDILLLRTFFINSGVSVMNEPHCIATPQKEVLEKELGTTLRDLHFLEMLLQSPERANALRNRSFPKGLDEVNFVATLSRVTEIRQSLEALK
jgi:hypothetical protein